LHVRIQRRLQLVRTARTLVRFSTLVRLGSK
jgi:hypothetical protein